MNIAQTEHRIRTSQYGAGQDYVWCYDCETWCKIPPPAYLPGDLLWVRETWRLYQGSDECGCDADLCLCPPKGTPIYQADMDDGESKWRPSIHMPKWACRLFLRVTAVRVERVQDISIDDCVAEGLGLEETPCPVRKDKIHSDNWYDGEGCEACGALSVRELFRSLWNDLYPGSWERNDWLWATTFERTEKPAGWPSA